MARPRTPGKILKLRGSFDRHPERAKAREGELGLPTCKPDPPATLTPAAREHWDDLAEKLFAAGILTALDVDALAAYCEAYARWLGAIQKLATEGSVIKDADGLPRHSPYLRVVNDSFNQMRVLLQEFGLSPSSRSKVPIAAPKAENPFAEIDRLKPKKKD